MGVGLVAATAVYLALQAYGLLQDDAYGAGLRLYAVATALLLSAVATGVMAVDLGDLWLRGRRFTAFSVKMLRSLVFVTVLAAVILTLVFRGPSLFLPMTPALVVYLIGTWRRPSAATPSTRRSATTRRSAATRASRSRQRRGGRRRRS
jgi:hypothetical protein